VNASKFPSEGNPIREIMEGVEEKGGGRGVAVRLLVSQRMKRSLSSLEMVEVVIV